MNCPFSFLGSSSRALPSWGAACALTFACAASFADKGAAQPIAGAAPPAASTAASANAAPQPLDVDAAIAQGRALLSKHDQSALSLLARAAQAATTQLSDAGGAALLTAPSEQMPAEGYLGTLAARTATAYYWWGIAFDQFGRKPEAVAVLSRAVRFAGPTRPGNTLGRDALINLNGVLREGLPFIVPDDVFETIAQATYGSAWAPRRLRVSLPDPSVREPRVLPAEADAATTGAVRPSAASPSAAFTGEFLITSGTLFPPPLKGSVSPTAGFTRIPTFYKNVPADKLPPSLGFDRMTLGFVRETSGPNKGQWRQVAQIFYASSFRTQAGRDDRPRAEMVCEQFLKVRSLFARALGVQNPFARDGVTKIYLSELSALWPDDEDDPALRAQMGPRMPAPNTPLHPGAPTGAEVPVQGTALERPWMPIIAAAQADSAPGEILFFKVAQERSESEWLREIAHEYSHVVLPTFGGFRPPNEPFANGTLGETLAMTWIAARPQAFAVQVPPPFSDEGLMLSVSLPANTPTVNGSAAFLPLSVTEVRAQVGQNALRALRAWSTAGPFSPLMRDTSPAGWTYLQGLGVYLERVYGSPLTGASLRRLQSTIPASDPAVLVRPLSANDWLNVLPIVWRDPFAVTSDKPGAVAPLPIWLPGALDGSTSRADDLVARTSRPLRPNSRVGAWLWVPPTATRLRVEWGGAGKLSVVGMATAPASPSGALNEALPPAAATSAEPRSDAAILLNVRGRSGWQRFVFAPQGQVTITRAQFERAP